MRIRRGVRPIALVGLFAILAGLGVPAAGPTPVDAAVHATALPAPPATWPYERLEIGFADSPGGAADLRADAPFGLRYQYLAGGVNTGNGWATWNTNGDFVQLVRRRTPSPTGWSRCSRTTMLLPSSTRRPATGEAAKDLNNLAATPTTMAAY